MSAWRRAAAAAGTDRPGRLGWSYIVLCGLLAAAGLFAILLLSAAALT